MYSDTAGVLPVWTGYYSLMVNQPGSRYGITGLVVAQGIIFRIWYENNVWTVSRSSYPEWRYYDSYAIPNPVTIQSGWLTNVRTGINFPNPKSIIVPRYFQNCIFVNGFKDTDGTLVVQLYNSQPDSIVISKVWLHILDSI